LAAGLSQAGTSSTSELATTMSHRRGITACPRHPRENLFPLVRQVNEDHVVIEIVARNGGNAVLMSAEDYVSLQETRAAWQRMRSLIWSLHMAMLSASAGKLFFAGGCAGFAVSCRAGGLRGRRCGPWFPVGGVTLVACIQDAWLAVAWAATVYLEQRGAGEQIAELGIAVVTGIEVRLLSFSLLHSRR
jgi:prevent-host-death family protein